MKGEYNMRLKCNDGKVREFGLPWTNNLNEEIEAQCLECGECFGIHDTKVLKPIFKKQ